MDGALIGTMQYMSPEQLEGLEADARSDIFAFGALLYEMATGQRPFNGTSQASLIASVLKEEPAPVSQIQPMVSPMLDQAISQCLAKDPDNRWQTAGDLKRALLWVADGGSMAGVPRPVSKRRRTRERVQWGVMTALVLATVALGWLFWQTTRTEVPVRQLTIPLGKRRPSGEYRRRQSSRFHPTARRWPTSRAIRPAPMRGCGCVPWIPCRRSLCRVRKTRGFPSGRRTVAIWPSTRTTS